MVDLYIPRDKETDKPKGFAFAEYETEEIADYAIRLFSGLVTLYNRTLKFAISGQDKPSLNTPNSHAPASNIPHKPRSHPIPINVNHSPASPGLNDKSNGNGSHSDGSSFEYGRRVLGGTLDSINRSRLRRSDSSNPVSYSSY